VTLKSLVAGLALSATVAGAAAGVMSISPVGSSAAPQVRLAVVGGPLPQDPAVDVPSNDDVVGILNSLADPNVPFRAKSGLVEGGIGMFEARTADKMMANAVRNGSMPLSFSVGNVLPSGPGSANALITASGPHLAPVTQNLTFVDQGGWKLSRASATALLSAASAAGG
jgi:hypothetical protein